MRIQPCIWTSYYEEFTPQTMLRKFARQGWYYLELSVEHGAQLLEQGSPEQVGQELRQEAADLDIQFAQGHLPWVGVDIAGEKPAKALDVLYRWLDLFAAAGVKQAVIHPGGRDRFLAKQPMDPVFGRNVESLQQLTGHIAQMGIQLCIENMDWTATTAQEILALINAVGSDAIGICLDTGHLHIVGGDQYQFITEAGQRLWALHIDDNEGQRDQHLMPYGRGSIRWDRVLQGLRAINYQGAFNLEISGERRCPLPVREYKLDCYRQIVSWMLTEEGRLPLE